MPMFKTKEEYYPMAGDLITKLYRLRRLQLKRAKIYNQVGFLKDCYSRGLIPKGFRNKQKVQTDKTNKLRSKFERLQVREQIQLLFKKMREIKTEIEHILYNVIWRLQPYIWVKIRQDYIEAEEELFKRHATSLKRKFTELLKEAGMDYGLQESNNTQVENFINISSYVLTEEERNVLSLGPKMIVSNSKVNNMEVAVDCELMMGKHQLDNVAISSTVNKVINKKTTEPLNLPKKQLEAIVSLKRNPQISIIKADKGNKFVIMNKSEYKEKLSELVSTNYNELKCSPSDKLDKELRKIINNVSLKNRTENKLFDKIICHYTREPSIFANPKIHKENMPFRPIISSYETVLSKAANYIAPILESIYDQLPGPKSEITNILEAKAGLLQNYKEGNVILFSFDVVNMFGNINTLELYHMLAGVIKKDNNFGNYTTLPKRTFLLILKLILENSFFMYENTYYAQKEGLPMGSPCSPILAKIAMHTLEQEWRKVEKFDLISYLGRYMDDYVGTWTGCKDDLIQLHEKLNMVDPNLKITIEMEEEGILHFLDAEITNENKTLIFRTYSKPYAASSMLPGNAFHDKEVIKSVPLGEAIRTLRISDVQEEDLKLLENKLLSNKYPLDVIKKQFAKAKKIETSRKANTFRKEKETEKEKPARLVTEYIGSKTEKLKKKLKHFKVKVTSKRRTNLEGIFASTFKTKTTLNKGIVYKIECTCGSTYIGESGFDMKKRQYDHLRDIRTKTKTNALYNHSVTCKGEYKWEESRLIEKDSNKLRRRYKEAILIKELAPEINVAPGMKVYGNWTL